MHKITDQEKQKILDMFHETEDAVLTAAVWGIDPAQVVAIAFFAGQPDRKPPARAEQSTFQSVRDALGRGKVLMFQARRVA